MEHRETEEMHEAVDQILRSALIAVGSVQQRLARRRQVAADQARMAASASRTETDAYTTAQDTMLHQSLRPATDPRWFDTSTPAERVATRDMADRFAEVNPYAKTVLEHIDAEAARRGEVLTPPENGGPEPTAESKQEASEWAAWSRRSAETQTPSPGPTIDTGPTQWPDAVGTAATEQSPYPPVSGPARRRPVAVDTTATEQEVADRLSASRSFPRPMWDQLRRNPEATLRPGSPTRLPRGRDKGLGL